MAVLFYVTIVCKYVDIKNKIVYEHGNSRLKNLLRKTCTSNEASIQYSVTEAFKTKTTIDP